MVVLAVADELPEPGVLWIRYRPRGWPAAPGLWLDPVRGRLGRTGPSTSAGELPSELGHRLDDVLYLPPVAQEHGAWRDRLLGQAVELDVPVLAQTAPGRPLAADGSRILYDLTEVLVRHDLDALAGLEPGAVLLWPLLPGLTDGPELVAAALERLAVARPSAVVSLVPDLDPAERRRLAELGGEESWDSLFHSGSPSLRDFCRAVHRAGLSPFLDRPLPAGPASVVGNRRLAARLALAAELWLRLERGADRGQGLFRAARWIDRERHDVARLAGEGNLGIVDGLEDEVRALIEEMVVTGRLGLLEELRAEYLE